MTDTPTHCGGCGVRNIDYTVYKNGTQSSRITLPITGVNPTYLLLKKQRFICKACNYSFTSKHLSFKRIGFTKCKGTSHTKVC
ncbi:transposase family protein [Paenisporosarcina sp. TG-14]|uniref:transposase family protein n=1 Tax=Paenisporosarcina sp. TG-14 TaxID=1231057 RepID=UPI00178C39B3